MNDNAAMGSTPLRLTRLILYASVTLILLPVQWLAVTFGRPLGRRLPLWYHRLCCRIIGLDVVVHGQISQTRPTLFVSNHTSYLDITALGSLIPGSFVAKTDVASWPFFGTLARLQRTVFVDRKARNARIDADTLRSRLDRGDQMILFPEGTSSDGNRTLPFKSALFAVASLRPATQSPALDQAETAPGSAKKPDQEGPALTIQPVSIVATHLDGIPLGREYRPVYAWYGDMDLAPHLWSAVGMGRLRVAVAFHEPVSLDAFSSRKALANHCWGAVADGVADLLSGRVDGVDRWQNHEDRAVA